MKYLLLLRFLTLTFVFLLLRKYAPEFAAPLSIFAQILHEIGHAVGTNLTGGEVLGFTLTTESTDFYACSRGGNAWFMLILGNLMSFAAAWFFVYLGTKGADYFRQILIVSGCLMLLTTQLVNDNNLLATPIVLIYLLLFIFFILTKTNWAGALLILFGFINLTHVANDALLHDFLSDVSRFQRLTPQIPIQFWVSIMLGATAFVGFKLLETVAATKVDWERGENLLRNWDFEKIGLFAQVFFPMLGFAFEQLFELLGVQFSRMFDGVKRYLSV